MDLLQRALPVDRLVVAIDPGKVNNRVWLSTDTNGLLVEPMTLPVLRQGLEQLARLIGQHAGRQPPVIAIEATGALHLPWTRELAQRFPDAVRLFAPSETVAARNQLGSRRFKTDDRDCAALTYLARQGHGRPVTADEQDALRRRSVIAAACCPSARSLSSGSTTRSTACAPACRRRPGTAASSS